MSIWRHFSKWMPCAASHNHSGILLPVTAFVVYRLNRHVDVWQPCSGVLLSGLLHCDWLSDLMSYHYSVICWIPWCFVIGHQPSCVTIVLWFVRYHDVEYYIDFTGHKELCTIARFVQRCVNNGDIASVLMWQHFSVMSHVGGIIC